MLKVIEEGAKDKISVVSQGLVDIIGTVLKRSTGILDMLLEANNDTNREMSAEKSLLDSLLSMISLEDSPL